MNDEEVSVPKDGYLIIGHLLKFSSSSTSLLNIEFYIIKIDQIKKTFKLLLYLSKILMITTQQGCKLFIKCFSKHSNDQKMLQNFFLRLSSAKQSFSIASLPESLIPFISILLMKCHLTIVKARIEFILL
jgi:hypothetical protein